MDTLIKKSPLHEWTSPKTRRPAKHLYVGSSVYWGFNCFCFSSQGTAETNKDEEDADSKLDLSFMEKVLNNLF